MKFLSDRDKKEFTKKVFQGKGKLPELQEILELLARGMSQTDIALKYGVSRQSISKIILKSKR